DPVHSRPPDRATAKRPTQRKLDQDAVLGRTPAHDLAPQIWHHPEQGLEQLPQATRSSSNARERLDQSRIRGEATAEVLEEALCLGGSGPPAVREELHELRRRGKGLSLDRIHHASFLFGIQTSCM